MLDAERSTSKSAVSREFVGRTGQHLDALMHPSLADVRLAAVMLDRIELKGRCCVVCLGVTTDGIKFPLGLWDGSTENKTITAHLLADLVERGLDIEQGVPQIIRTMKVSTYRLVHVSRRGARRPARSGKATNGACSGSW